MLLLLLETVIVRQMLLSQCMVIVRWLSLEPVMDPGSFRALVLWSVSSCAAPGIQESKTMLSELQN